MKVSLVIHSTVADAPVLAMTLPHIVRQARFAFSECVVTIDPTVRDSDDVDRGALDRILAEALSSKIVDRVVEVPTDGRRRELHRRYFGVACPGLPAAGRDITARLAGLEAAREDTVTWCAADVLMHASGRGWVAEGIDAITRDERVWLASTRGGPGDDRPASAGDRGGWLASIRSAVRAPAERTDLLSRWLDALAPRPSGATASHFVCDRRRLRGTLRWVDSARDEAGAYLRDALARHDAKSIVVGGGWHLRSRFHARPFAQWIDRLVGAVERGEVPACQRDGWLVLEDAVQRSEWRRVLFTADEIRRADSEKPRPVARLVHRRPTPGALPISVIIPIRNRAGVDVANSLASLAWQQGRPFETIVVSHGSDPRIEAELRELAVRAGATLIAVGTPADPWNKPLALNTGIRATDPSVPYVMTMDADMILAENLLATVIAELEGDRQRIVLCQSSDLPESCMLPGESELRASFEKLRGLANVRGEHGTGGIQAVRRSFLVEVRGYDEDMLWWGALDTDLVRRGESVGMRTTWVTERTAMLHQWHPRKHRILDDASADEARESWLRNHEMMLERSKSVVRNQGGWGAELDDERGRR